MTADHQVLIVGAGPVGLSAALALSKLGIDIAIIDAGNDVDRRMRASTFHPPTLDIIESLGLKDELLRRGLRAPFFQVRQHNINEYVRFDLERIRSHTKHPYRLQVEQHHFCDLAIEKLKERGIDVQFGIPLKDVRQDDDVVDASTSAGKITCDWLIGADGSSSAVRKSLGLEYGGMTYTHSSVLVSLEFPFDEHLDDLDSVSYCWSSRGPFSLLQLQSFWRASLYPGVESLDEAAEEDRVRDWLEFIHPKARDANILDINPYRVHERCVDKFRVGRVFLAGDAAHLNPPSGGMGMNGGIHDAMNLAAKLLRVISGVSPDLLDQYHRQRHTIVTQRINPQAAANRERMSAMNIVEQTSRLHDHRLIAADPEQCEAFLLRSSMITGLREAQAIE